MSRHNVSGRLWTEDTVIAAIRSEAHAGHDLCYSRTRKRVPALIRAAERIFGSWGSAIQAAGYDYEDIRRYRAWTRERIIERIRAWHQQDEDLSWRHVATTLDPPLAAAALHAGRFASWSDALAAAGLNPEDISRYRRWNIPTIREELRFLEEQGVSLDQETLVREAAPLLAAIYRVGQGLVAERNALIRFLNDDNLPLLVVEEWDQEERKHSNRLPPDAGYTSTHPKKHAATRDPVSRRAFYNSRSR